MVDPEIMGRLVERDRECAALRARVAELEALALELASQVKMWQQVASDYWERIEAIERTAGNKTEVPK